MLCLLAFTAAVYVDLVHIISWSLLIHRSSADVAYVPYIFHTSLCREFCMLTSYHPHSTLLFAWNIARSAQFFSSSEIFNNPNLSIFIGILCILFFTFNFLNLNYLIHIFLFLFLFWLISNLCWLVTFLCG
jgi:hypothetical protein